MKKYFLVFFLILIVLSVVGCTESGTKETSVSSAETPSSGQESLQQSSSITYQDTEWAQNVGKHFKIISPDLNNISKATRTMDTYSLNTSAMFLEAHTKTAIEECDSYTVSPELQPGKDEYRAGNVDANNAATLLILATSYLKSGDTISATQSIQLANDKLESCGDHFVNASVVVKEYNKEHGLGTENSSQQSTPILQSTETQTQANMGQTVATQDDLWINHLQKYLPLLEADFNNMGMASKNEDYNALHTYGIDIITDSNNALNESQSYTVSSKYTDAKTEWELALRDCHTSGQYVILIANSGENGKNNMIYAQEFQNYSNSGLGHLNRATAFIKGANT